MKTFALLFVIVLNDIPPLVALLNCETPNTTTAWTAETMSLFTISIKEDEFQKGVNSSEPSKWINPEVEVPHPSVYIVPYGTRVRIHFPDEYNASVIRRNESNFDDCNIIDEDFLNISNKTVYLGNNTSDFQHHYILVRRSDNCNDSLKINITFKSEECSTTETEVCSGHGHCLYKPKRDAFSCSCCGTYTGKHCEIESSSNTQDNETSPSDHGSFHDTESSGRFSLRDLCLKNGMCRTSPPCQCDFDALNCDTKSACPTEVCVHGICVVTNGSRNCYCRPGYHGKNCEKKINECLSRPCANDGRCLTLRDGYRCMCLQGYTGVHCEEKVNLCVPNPCLHHSECIDEGSSYVCQCSRGYNGRHCETEINECLSNPCLYNGLCRDHVNGYQCICTETHAGPNCEITVDLYAPPLNAQIQTIPGNINVHSLYIIVGVLSSILFMISFLVVICYCRLNRTYNTLSWSRLIHTRQTRSNSTSSLEVLAVNRPRLSIDALWETTSVGKDTVYRSTDICTPLVTKEV